MIEVDIFQVQQLLGPSSLSRDLDFPREQEVTVIRNLEFFKGFFPFLPPKEGIKKVCGGGFKAFPIKGGGLFSPKKHRLSPFSVFSKWKKVPQEGVESDG